MGLTKRPDSYYVEFYVLDDGKTFTLAPGVGGAKLKRWKVSSHNKTMAKQQEALIKTDLMKGLVKSDQVQGPMTFKALTERYLSHPDIRRQSSCRWKEQTVESRLLLWFGNQVLRSISAGMIEEYREHRRKQKGRQGTTLKVATINRDLALLKHLFSYAIREEWLEHNPVSKIKLEKENNARDRVLTPQEFDVLQAHSSASLQAINTTAYLSAMRRGEILNLTWDRVDLKNGLIKLRAEDTKTREGQLIPLTQELTALLRDLYKVRYLNEPRVFLVKGKSVASIKTAFNAACRRAKIEGFKFHDFRHTAVTNMRRAGIDHLTIMKITGHKTLDVFKRYNSFMFDDLKAAARKFNTLITLAHQPAQNDTDKFAINQAVRP
jgi:integrase